MGHHFFCSIFPSIYEQCVIPCTCCHIRVSLSSLLHCVMCPFSNDPNDPSRFCPILPQNNQMPFYNNIGLRLIWLQTRTEISGCVLCRPKIKVLQHRDQFKPVSQVCWLQLNLRSRRFAFSCIINLLYCIMLYVLKYIGVISLYVWAYTNKYIFEGISSR